MSSLVFSSSARTRVVVLVRSTLAVSEKVTTFTNESAPLENTNGRGGGQQERRKTRQPSQTTEDERGLKGLKRHRGDNVVFETKASVPRTYVPPSGLSPKTVYQVHKTLCPLARRDTKLSKG